MGIRLHSRRPHLPPRRIQAAAHRMARRAKRKQASAPGQRTETRSRVEGAMKAIQSILIFATVGLITSQAKAFDLKTALAAAKPGDTIRVPAGQYDAPLLIDKPV